MGVDIAEARASSVCAFSLLYVALLLIQKLGSSMSQELDPCLSPRELNLLRNLVDAMPGWRTNGALAGLHGVDGPPHLRNGTPSPCAAACRLYLWTLTVALEPAHIPS
jgi:hypothetical protein